VNPTSRVRRQEFRVRRLLLALIFHGAFSAQPAPPAPAEILEQAIGLFQARKFPEAQAALSALVAAEPANARACHYLGRTLELRADAGSLAEAVKWHRRAAELEPENPIYLGRYGGASLLLAARDSSLGAAWRGRDAMEKAVRLDPTDLDAREGLVHFYQRAPWPLGSRARAAAHLEAIRQRDPIRATVLGVLGRTNVGDYAGAFRLCEEALAANPADYNALYQFGRTAELSGENLHWGISCLEKCLSLGPPTPASPTHSVVWQRIGGLHEKLQHPAVAVAAYEAALRHDAGNHEAAAALQRVKSAARNP